VRPMPSLCDARCHSRSSMPYKKLDAILEARCHARSSILSAKLDGIPETRYHLCMMPDATFM
jgi:hypothetical protein